MKIVQLVGDNREHYKDYASAVPCFGAAPEALLDGLSQMEGIEVHVISCLRRTVASPAKIFQNLHYHSLTVPKSGWMTSLYCGCIKATRSLIREIAPDVVHGQGTEGAYAMCAVHSGFPNLVTIHGNISELYRLGINFENHRVYGFLASMLENHALARCDGVFCNSSYTEALVSTRTHRTWRVPNAIRSRFFMDLPGMPLSSTVPLLLNVGQLGVRKRQHEILLMAGRLHRLGFRFHLVFVGGIHEGNDYGRMFVSELKQAEAMGYASHAGMLDTVALISLMDSAHGFIHFPSEEAFGLVVVEAMARGLKFFGANLGGIRDIAAHIQGAELYDDVEALTMGLSDWLASGAPTHEDAALQIAERYHPKVVAQLHLDIYQEVLGR